MYHVMVVVQVGLHLPLGTHEACAWMQVPYPGVFVVSSTCLVRITAGIPFLLLYGCTCVCMFFHVHACTHAFVTAYVCVCMFVNN